MAMPRNPEQKGLWVGGGLLVAGLLLLILPGALGLDGMDGGFALGALGLLLAITGVITVLLYLPRVRRLERLLTGDSLLAHWVYRPADLERQVARDRAAEAQRNRALLLIVSAWLVFWGAIFVIYGVLTGQGEHMPLFVAIMAGVGLIVAAAAYLAPGAHARRAQRSSGECFIGREGLFINGVYHPWVGRLARLERVVLEEQGSAARLVFHLAALSGPGYLHWTRYTVEAPAPADRLEEARWVVSELGARR